MPREDPLHAPQPRSSGPWHTAVGAVLRAERAWYGRPEAVFWLGLAISVLLCARRPDAAFAPRFWAEDGIEFFRAQLIRGSLGALTAPYAGYLHAVPRLTAAAASLLPVFYAPLIYNATAIVLAGLSCALFVSPAYRWLLPSDRCRLLVCVTAATAFHSDELLGNITNVQWFLALSGILLVARPLSLDRHTSPWGVAALTVALALIGLTAPITAVVAPFAIAKAVRAWRWGARLAAMPTLGLVLALGAQATVFVFHARFGGGGFEIAGLAPSVLTALAGRVVLSSTLGHGTAEHVLRREWYDAGALTSALALIGWLAWLYRRLPARTFAAAAVSVLIALASIAVAIMVRGLSTPTGVLTIAYGRSERYFFLGSCLFAYLVALSAHSTTSSTHPRSPARLWILLFAGGLLGNFHVPAYAIFAWQQQAASVTAWKVALDAGRPVGAMAFMVNPGLDVRLPASAFLTERFEHLGDWHSFGAPLARARRAGASDTGQALCLAGAGEGGVYQDRVGLRAGHRYRVTASVLGDFGSTASAGIWVHDGEGRDASSSGVAQRPPTWTPVGTTFRANRTQTVRIHLLYAGQGRPVCFSDVTTHALD